MDLASLRTQRLGAVELQVYEEECRRRSKSVLAGYALWLLLGCHYGYARRWGWQIAFWLTGGGLFVWWLIDLFRVPFIIDACNQDIADEVFGHVAATHNVGGSATAQAHFGLVPGQDNQASDPVHFVEVAIAVVALSVLLALAVTILF